MAHRKQEESEPPGIVVLYTSLMILLLAFFILLNAVSKVEESRVESVFESLQGTFGFHQGGVSPLDSSSVDSTQMTSLPINPVDHAYTQIKGLVKRAGLSKKVKLLRSDSIKSVVMPALLLFEPESTSLSPEGVSFLTGVAAAIGDSSYPVTLKGHTDDAPSFGAGKSANWDVSAQRALAVLRFLVSRGINPGRLAAFGLAGFHPLAPNDTPYHRRLNNRVEMVFDSRDLSMYQVPEGDMGRKLDFRGFTFDLVPKGEK